MRDWQGRRAAKSSLPPRRGVAMSTRPDGLVWGCEEGESSQGVLCRAPRTKVNFAGPLSKSVASVARRPVLPRSSRAPHGYVYSVFEWYEYDKRRSGMRKFAGEFPEPDGSERRAGRWCVPVCHRFDYKAGLAYVSAVVTGAGAVAYPPDEAIGRPARWLQGARPGAPTPGPCLPDRYHGDPLPWLSRKVRSTTPSASLSAPPHLHCIPPARQSPRWRPHHMNHRVTVPPAPAGGASPHLASIAPDQGRRDTARTSERTG
jgi:hypothetical protein